MRDVILTRSEALDLSSEHYLAGNILTNPDWDAPLAEIEAALSYWNVTVLEDED
ncbi:hypothetical protein [Nocardioides aurantiacus]|uniref:hypothetical protein n=1 Tax=Nocardioides aurantiacus TaxID=86796 RepID=UPI001FE89FEC|nr:hypothetical protein [Nocardioides aurantiacus]